MPGARAAVAAGAAAGEELCHPEPSQSLLSLASPRRSSCPSISLLHGYGRLFLPMSPLSLSLSLFLLTESLGVPPCSQLTGFPGYCSCVPPCGTLSLCLPDTRQPAPPHSTIHFGNLPSSLQPLCLCPEGPVHPSLSLSGSAKDLWPRGLC